MTSLSVYIIATNDDVSRKIITNTPAYEFVLNHSAETTGAQNSAEKKFGAGMRFQNVTIAKGSTINSAYLKMYSAANQNNMTPKTMISAEAVDNAGDFSGDNKTSFDSRYANHSTAVVYWDSIPGWSNGAAVTSPDIKTVIQEMVDRSGWNSGNSIVIFWEDFAGRSILSPDWATRYTWGYDHGSSIPYLLVDYTAPVGAPAKRSYGVIVG